MIESSKAYAKLIMEKYHVPTAEYQLFDVFEQAFDYCTTFEPPYVIKYDGLAFGKGVTIAQSLSEAKDVLYHLLEKRIYGHAKVLIEEFLEGQEFSMICMVHHHTVVALPCAKDHKSRYEDNKGPNTGGMGAYSPVDYVDHMVFKQSLEMMQRVADGMVNENNPFTGFLYGGFMLTKNGPKIIEFNCRLGDPEAEVILPRIRHDFIEAIEDVCNDLQFELVIDEDYHLGVVMVSDGYPGPYDKHHLIDIPFELNQYIYQMGTTLKDHQIVSEGGRVLCVNGKGQTLEQARKMAYDHVSKLRGIQLKFRKDIGQSR
jgi:phosphoribosylamine---glycine ligase